jgi:hypothetical protein
MKVGDLIRVPDALDKSGAYGLVVYEPYEESKDWRKFDAPLHMEEIQLVGILFMDGTVDILELQDVVLVSRV